MSNKPPARQRRTTKASATPAVRQSPEAAPDPLRDQTIIAQRDLIASDLDRMGGLVVEILRSLFGTARSHSITHRVKDGESLGRKLAAKPGKYRDLDDVTDVLGVRIVTYFPDEVDKLAQIVEAHFDIDRENSIDRRATLEPDRFGYLSLHYVARLSAVRQGLAEYGPERGRRFEIQIRSILQHAWAEIEHDLGYHTEAAIPPDIRRRFSRLAGLLEIADAEFEAIRDDMAAYAKRLPDEIRDHPDRVPVNVNSIFALMQANTVVEDVDRSLLAPFGAPTIDDADRDYAVGRAEELLRLGFRNIKDVQTALEDASDELPRFARNYLGRQFHDPSIPAGISLFYLLLFEVGRQMAAGDLTQAGAARVFAGRGGGRPRRWLAQMRSAYLDAVEGHGTVSE